MEVMNSVRVYPSDDKAESGRGRAGCANAVVEFFRCLRREGDSLDVGWLYVREASSFPSPQSAVRVLAMLLNMLDANASRIGHVVGRGWNALEVARPAVRVCGVDLGVKVIRPRIVDRQRQGYYRLFGLFI